MSERVRPAPVAVVTGATSGFGREIFRRLIADDWMVVGVARHEDDLDALTDEFGGQYEVCDISDRTQVRATAGTILGRHPSVGLLVNSAGMPLRGEYSKTTDRDVRRVMETNYDGPYMFTRALLPGLVAAASADVIHMVSAGGTITNPHSAAYGASKHAQLGLSRMQTVEFRPHGIRVHAILPGKAHTKGHPQKPSSSPFSKLTRTNVDKVATATMNRIGKRPREVYVPRRLKLAAVANSILPVTTGRIANRLLS